MDQIKEIKGVIESIEQKISSKKKVYYLIKINDVYIGDFNCKAKGYEQDDSVCINYIESGKFKNLDSIYYLEGEEKKKAINTNDRRQTLIIRQSCISSACEAIGRATSDPKALAKDVLEVAEKFEKWVLRE